MTDGDLKITQSKAILYYVGRKLNLMGKTPAEEAQVMMLCEQAYDLRMQIAGICYGPNGGSKDERKKFVDTVLNDALKLFDAYLGKHNTKFAVGNHPTIADFQLYEHLEAGLALDEDNTLLDKYPNAKRLLKAVRELPELSDYIAKTHAKLPLNNKSKACGCARFLMLTLVIVSVAKFGNKVIEQK